jgi:glucokinase
MILVCDVGGTRTRLALAAKAGGAWELSGLEEAPTTPDIAARIARYLGDRQVAAAAFGAAGPPEADGSIRLTNAGVLLEPAELARAAGGAPVVLVNDFRAIAEAIPHLPQSALQHCGGGAAVAGQSVVVLGPGTGLGVAIRAAGLGGWHVVHGEGGHADLAAVDDEELDAWQRLRRAHGRISAEMVLSGPGLERLYAVLSGRALPAAEIDAAAWRVEPEAVLAHALFTRWLGRVAGNLALIAGARGGVYLAGGILPRWGAHFDAAAFRRSFEDKPPYSQWLRRIPSFVVMHPQPGLLGLAVLAGAAA